MIKYRVELKDIKGHVVGIYTGEVSTTGNIDFDVDNATTITIKWKELNYDGNDGNDKSWLD